MHRTGSLSGASRVLGVPRTSVRRRLDSLEALVGAPLLQLGRDGAELTPAGRLMAERGAGLTTEFGNLLQSARLRATRSGGGLRLLLPHGFAPQMVAAWYGIAREERPQMQLIVRFHRALDELNPEEFDLALQFALRPPPGPWRCRVIGRVKTRLLASEGYLERHGAPCSIEELCERDLALWVPKVGDDESLPQADGRRLTVRPSLVSANIAIVRWLALNGDAIAFLPDAEVPDVAQPTGGLRPVMDDVIRGEIAIWTIVPEVLAEDPNVRWAIDRWCTTPPEIPTLSSPK